MVPCSRVLLLVLAVLTALTAGSDLVTYQLSSQMSCEEVIASPTKDCRWVAGLHVNADQVILGGDVVAYQIQWFSGAWSEWFVTGYNDIDIKFNPLGQSCSIPYLADSMRRRWSNFYDHTHRYIVCRNP